MFVLWDTDSFFLSSLQSFGADLNKINQPKYDNWDRQYFLDIAFAGYCHVTKHNRWPQDIMNQAKDFIKVDLLPSNYTWFEEDAIAIACFTAYILGGLLGKMALLEIDNKGVMLGIAHLATFNVDNDIDICSLYNKVNLKS